MVCKGIAPSRIPSVNLAAPQLHAFLPPRPGAQHDLRFKADLPRLQPHSLPSVLERELHQSATLCSPAPRWVRLHTVGRSETFFSQLSVILLASFKE